MLKVGMVGVGCISGIYLKNFAEVFRDVELVAVCDLIRELSGGRLAGQVDAKTATQEDIMTLAAKYA